MSVAGELGKVSGGNAATANSGPTLEETVMVWGVPERQANPSDTLQQM